jgi:hypothetical protein
MPLYDPALLDRPLRKQETIHAKNFGVLPSSHVTLGTGPYQPSYLGVHGRVFGYKAHSHTHLHNYRWHCRYLLTRLCFRLYSFNLDSLGFIFSQRQMVSLYLDIDRISQWGYALNFDKSSGGDAHFDNAFARFASAADF